MSLPSKRSLAYHEPARNGRNGGGGMGNRRAVGPRLGVSLSLGVVLIALASFGGAASGAPSASTPGSSVPTPSGGVKGQSGYLVYWDQNEEVDFLSMPKGTQGQLLPAWDLNGQMCVLPGGRFVGGYDPTLPSQHNLGGLKPYKQPADGEELDEPNGSFSGQTLYVPGPYKMKGQSIGSDSPPTRERGVQQQPDLYRLRCR